MLCPWNIRKTLKSQSPGASSSADGLRADEGVYTEEERLPQVSSENISGIESSEDPSESTDQTPAEIHLVSRSDEGHVVGETRSSQDVILSGQLDKNGMLSSPSSSPAAEGRSGAIHRPTGNVAWIPTGVESHTNISSKKVMQPTDYKEALMGTPSQSVAPTETEVPSKEGETADSARYPIPPASSIPSNEGNAKEGQKSLVRRAYAAAAGWVESALVEKVANNGHVENPTKWVSLARSSDLNNIEGAGQIRAALRP